MGDMSHTKVSDNTTGDHVARQISGRLRRHHGLEALGHDLLTDCFAALFCRLDNFSGDFNLRGHIGSKGMMYLRNVVTV